VPLGTAEPIAYAEAIGGDLGQLCDALVGRIGSEGAPDDIALLAARLEPADERLDLRLPADPAVLTDLRRRLGRLLRAAGASRQEQYEITLTVCEAAANAIEHAYGPGDAEFELEVAEVDGEIRVAVRDSGAWKEQEPGRDEHREGTRGRGLGIIHGLMDDVEVSRRESGTTVTMRRKLGRANAA
jgi:anti-sigma regulatory factor (Ser/Thr protein kinase)